MKSKKIPRVRVNKKTEVKNGKEYHSFVASYTIDGNWKAKQFPTLREAESYAAMKQVELNNEDSKRALMLSDSQLAEAISAFQALGDDYTLKQAVDYFLANHRPPEFTIPFKQAIGLYIDAKEIEGLRPATFTKYRYVLKKFSEQIGEECEVHEITTEKINVFLNKVAIKGTKLTRKTWNNYRNTISAFFVWAGKKDLATSRPWTFNNPVESVNMYQAKQVQEQKPDIITTSPEELREHFTKIMNFQEGALAKFYAVAYFAGVRTTGEMTRLAEKEDEFINLRTGYFNIPASVSKNKEIRKIKISDNLLKWLKAYEDRPLIPEGFLNMKKRLRKQIKLSKNEARHSFISYHVALNRSIGDASLMAGNSERMVKKHYFRLHTQEEGEHFFSLVPDMKSMTCVRDLSCKLGLVEELRVI